MKLIVVHGKHAGQEVTVPGPKFFIGRAEDCDLRPQSDLISRHHCAVLVEEGYVAVRDFGSKNGTYVNGRRVRIEAELKSGDRLKIGPLEFEVQLAVDVAGKKLPKVRSVQEVVARTAEPPRPKPAETPEELEVGDWLEEDAAAPMADTTTMDPTRTVGVPPGTSAEPTPQETPAEPVAQEPAEPEEPPQPQVPGKFSGSLKTDAATSREAASKGLRTLFRHFG
ncbi:MAG: FHA domain-containing protein [Thermoguttaceae bacterium]